ELVGPPLHHRQDVLHRLVADGDDDRTRPGPCGIAVEGRAQSGRARPSREPGLLWGLDFPRRQARAGRASDADPWTSVSGKVSLLNRPGTRLGIARPPGAGVAGRLAGWPS